MKCPCCNQGELPDDEIIVFRQTFIYAGKMTRLSDQEADGLQRAISGYQGIYDNAISKNVSHARAFLKACNIPAVIIRSRDINNTHGKYELVYTDKA